MFSNFSHTIDSLDGQEKIDVSVLNSLSLQHRQSNYLILQ